MLIQSLFLVLGLVLLIKGADLLVEGASALARRYKVSDLAIGLTIVAFGTSAPELVINTYASWSNHQDIVFGNIIGSNNFNLFAILGIAGLITPLVVQSSTAWKEIPVSLGAVFILYLLANDWLSPGTFSLSIIEGLILLVFFALFLYYVYKQLRTETETVVEVKPLSNFKTWSFLILGLAGLIIGGRMVLSGSVEIATALGMSEKLVGLTIVAAGTSLPELATSVIAAMKKNNDIAVGNIIGSNIFNIFLILGVSALIRPLAFDTRFNFDLGFLAAGTAILFVFLLIGKKKQFKRWQAALFLAAYIGYTYFLISGEM